jgi:uncharacterized membrane protein
MEQLEKLLIEIPGDEKEEALNFYSNYFEDAGEENEEKIIRELGSPERVARTIKADLLANEGYSKVGEYTEHGYKDADEIKDSIIKVEPSVTKTEGEAETKTEVLNNQEHGNNQQGNYNQNQGFNQQGNNNQYNQGQGFNQQGNNNQYNQSQGFNQQGNTNQNNQNQGYNQQGYYQNQGYNQQGNPYNNQGYQSYPQTTSRTNIPALILLCVFAVPLIFPLTIAGFATIFGLVVGFGAAGFACSVAGLILVVTGMTKIVVLPMFGVMIIGGGLICFGIGVLFIILTILIAKGFPLICRAVAAIFRAPFGGRRVAA